MLQMHITMYKRQQEGQPFRTSRQGKLVLLGVIWLLWYLPAFGDSVFDISPAQNTGKLWAVLCLYHIFLLVLF